jgi:DNA modification methylase
MERIPHLLISNLLGRHSIGQDISEKFFKHDVEKVKRKILERKFLFPEKNKIIEESKNKFISILNGLRFDMYLGDSRDLSFLEDESVDFVITSPPYWDLGNYGDEDGQIGTGKSGKTYESFLLSLGQILQECNRVLKSNRFISLQVNDFRKDNVFCPFHSDVIFLMKRLGFKFHDIRVYRTGGLSAIFASELEEQKRSAKTHEYILIFRKNKFIEFDDDSTPELLRNKKIHCPRCNSVMISRMISFTHNKYLCLKCNYSQTKRILSFSYS